MISFLKEIILIIKALNYVINVIEAKSYDQFTSVLSIINDLDFILFYIIDQYANLWREILINGLFDILLMITQTIYIREGRNEA